MKHFSKLLLFAIILCLSVAAGRMFFAFSHNYQNIYRWEHIPNTFTPDNWSPWLAEWPLEDMVQLRLQGGYGRMNGRSVFLLEAPVRYYLSEGDVMRLAAEVPEGTRVMVEGYPSERGRGLQSWPSYEKGWRYVRPLHVVDGTALLDEDEFYYVPLRDLSRATETFLNSGTELAENILQQAKEQNVSIRTVRMRILFLLDAVLYTDGVFCSHDFYHPYFDTANIILLSSAGVLLAVYIVLRMRKQKT